MISSDTFSLTDAEQSRFAHVQRLSSDGTKNVSELLAQLTDPNWVIRRSVVEALARLGDLASAQLIHLLRTKRDNEARIAAVVDALSTSSGEVEEMVSGLAGDPDAAIVADVAQILGRRRSSKVIPVLVKLTKHENDNVAVGAIEGLGRIGGRAAVEALIEIVGGRNFFRVFPAIDVLGRSGDPRSVAPLVELLADPMYQYEAARALGRSGDKAAVAPLMALLASSSDSSVRVAATALSDLRERYQEKSGGEPLIFEGILRGAIKKETIRRLGRMLPHVDTAEAIAICNLLGVTGDAEAAQALTVALDADAAIAGRAAKALKKIGQDAELTLLTAIREGTSERRKLLLPLVTRTSMATEISACLTDKDSDVRAATCDTLARLGNPAVVSKIFLLLEDPNLRVVHAATAAIQALGSREARDQATAAYDSSNPIVRRSALRILGNMGDASAVIPMLKGLSDADARVREAAIQSLPLLENEEALEALYTTAEDQNPRTRALAMRALGQLSNGEPRAYPILLKGLTDSDPWTRYYASQSVGRLKYAPAAESVARLLADEAGQVRVAAVEALSHLSSSVAHEALREAASSTDLEVRRAALVGLGITQRAEDLVLLLDAVKSGDVSTRLISLSALAKFSSDRVLAALSSAAADHDEQVSTSAVSFLGSRREQEATEILVELLEVPAVAERAKAALLSPSESRAAGLLVALESADDELAATLISILSRLERPEARNALLSAMKLKNVAARKAAAPALATRRDAEMKQALQDASENDPDQGVREISALLLRQ